ncbi:MAG: hypothetical protein LBM04_11020 [Opitutaceae bacterium]|jgi:hypothetical protein|nr:hypothetical protein [Opitutaceae bacterium]
MKYNILHLFRCRLFFPFFAGFSAHAIAADATPAAAPISWGNQVWQIQIDPASGALVHIENKDDPHHMNWLRSPGHWEYRDWVPETSSGARTSDGQWGLVSTTQTGLMHVAQTRRLSERAWEAVCTSAALTVVVRRELDAGGDLIESYTFKNTGVVDMTFPVGSISITAPFFDQYPDSRESLTRRCHAHLWMGGGSAWINAMRMGAESPHLGLVVTQGALENYSQHGGAFNDRGVFLLHPGAIRLKHNETATLSWRLFWHKGWDDFFIKAAATPGFVRLTAKNYVVTAGQPLEITAESTDSLASAKILVDGIPAETYIKDIKNGRISASIPTSKPGDIIITLDDEGRKSILRAFVTPPVDALIEARLKFIIRKQQRNAPGDPLDGAYLSYDNETGKQVYSASTSDHNAGRERVGMGVLGALYLPLCRDAAFKAELAESLKRYSDFITRELENEDGVVFEQIGRKKSGRLYNFSWVAHFHLAMYQATGDRRQLDCFVRVLRAYYATKEGAHFHLIGMPVTDGLKALEQAGRNAERVELLGKIREHADNFLKRGTDYPRAEVNYEQSIVGPAVQLLAELHLATGENRYLEGAKVQMPLLEAFAGRQPDSRLYEISIRHWDDFWFGKYRVYGDTMPHYWSAINAAAFAYYGIATKDAEWLRRADAVVKGNLSLFTPDGAGSAAHLHAFATNGQRGERNDPWANDQDWALVYLLMTRALSKS